MFPKLRFLAKNQKDRAAMAPIQSISANRIGTGESKGFVEIALLVPANRMDALLDLSVQRQQSVGQLLRQLIDRALADHD
jgi:hypothetical protein